MFRHPDVGVSLDFLNDVSRNIWYKEKIKSLVPGKVVYEIGTGVGLLGAYALEAGAKHYYGIDVRSSRAALCRNILSEIGYTNYNIFTGDFFDLKKQDVPQDVDMVICELTGYQFGNGFEMRNFWNHANQLFGKNWISLPDMWSVNAYVYEGIVGNNLPDYLPKTFLDDPSLPTGFHQAICKTDFVQPSQVIEGVLSLTPQTASKEIEFEIDLSGYRSATIVLSDQISYQGDTCRAVSYVKDWPGPIKLEIKNADSKIRFFWDWDQRILPVYKSGFWKYCKS